MTLRRFSKSQIVMHQGCPHQHYLAYVEKLRRPPSGAMKLGIHYHDVVGGNYKQKARTTTDLPLDEQTDRFRQIWKDDAELSDTVFDEGETADQLKEVGTGLVAAHHTIIAPKVMPASEQAVEEPLRQLIVKPIGERAKVMNLDGNWRESGQQGERIFEEIQNRHPQGLEYAYMLDSIVDVTDSDGVIRENKTAARVMNQMDADKLVDLTQYAIAKRIQTGKAETGLAVDQAIKTKKPQAVTVRTKRSPEQIRAHLDHIGHISRMLDAHAYPPNTSSWLCNPKYCGYFGKACIFTRGITTVDMGENLTKQLEDSIAKVEA